MTLEVVNAYASGQDVVLLSRDEAGNQSVRRERGEYVAFLRDEDLPAERLRQLRREPDLLACAPADGRGWVRTRWRDWPSRKDALERLTQIWSLRTYEGDVSSARRWMIDNDAAVARPRRAYFDIETDSRVPFARKEEMRILSWVVVDDERKVQVGVLKEDRDQAEWQLLCDFFRALAPYDQACAWNGDGFDVPVIRARSKRCGIKPELMKRWLWLDQMENFKRQNMHGAASGAEKQSFALNAIANALLGRGKADFDARYTWQAWSAGGSEGERMVQYMVNDGLLLPEIEAATGYVDLLTKVCQVCGVLPDTWGMRPTSQVDGIMMRLGKREGVHFPTKHAVEPRREKFRGAWVMKPACKGIQRDVHVFDFSGMYPSIIMSWNMSFETKVEGASAVGPLPEGCCRTPTTGATFRASPRGLLARAVWEIGEMRRVVDERKAALPPGTPEWLELDRESQALKVVRNGFYGVFGSEFSRFGDVVIGEGISQTGRWLIEHTFAAGAERIGMRALYGDTDSGFVSGVSAEAFREFVAWCNAELYPRLTRERGCAENHVRLAFEKTFDRLVMVAAKTYTARYASYKGKAATEDSKPEIKGLAYKRGDALLLTRRLQGEVIDLLCGGLKLARVPVPTECVEDFEEAVLRHRDRVLGAPLSVEEVMLSQSLARSLGEYVIATKKDGTLASGPMHVRAGRKLEALGEDVSVGTKVQYVVVDGHASPKTIILAQDYDGECDRVYLWSERIYPATESLLAAAFPDRDWARFRVKRLRKARGKAPSPFEGVAPALLPSVPAGPTKAAP